MNAQELWSTVVPNWLTAFGQIVAAGIAAWALISSKQTAGGVETLRQAANDEAVTSPGEGGSTVSPADGSTPAGEAAPGSTAPGPGRGDRRTSPVRWTTWQERRGHHRLRNDSIHTGASATLVGFRDVTPNGDGAAQLHMPLPVKLEPNDSIPFTINKSLASPAVTAVEIEWVDEDGTTRSRRLYI